jgi:hypothetical protein
MDDGGRQTRSAIGYAILCDSHSRNEGEMMPPILRKRTEHHWLFQKAIESDATDFRIVLHVTLEETWRRAKTYNGHAINHELYVISRWSGCCLDRLVKVMIFDLYFTLTITEISEEDQSPEIWTPGFPERDSIQKQRNCWREGWHLLYFLLSYLLLSYHRSYDNLTRSQCLWDRKHGAKTDSCLPIRSCPSITGIETRLFVFSHSGSSWTIEQFSSSTRISPHFSHVIVPSSIDISFHHSFPIASFFSRPNHFYFHPTPLHVTAISFHHCVIHCARFLQARSYFE